MRKLTIALGALCVAVLPTLGSAAVTYLDPKPLTSVVSAGVSDCPATIATWSVPTIAWGADIATILGNGNAKRTAPGSIFAGKKLDISLYRQDDFQKQVSDYLSCKTPFIRGTMGMLNQAAEVLARDPRTAPIVIYQLSWSNGGDVLVVKQGINAPADLKGKTIAVQAYGPHVDYALKVLADAGLMPADVHLKFVKDLLQVDNSSVSPTLAFRTDPTVDAAFVISPDASALTSGMAVGTGAEDSVRGAKPLLSTKTANRIIADVYAVRSDFFQAHRAQVQDFVSGLLLAQEKLADLMKSKQGDAYKQMTTAAAEFLLDSPTAIDDTVGMYADAELVGYPGNVKFFGDPDNLRNFERITTEIQQALAPLGLMSKQVPLVQAKWDYAALKAGLSNTGGVELPRFNTAVVQGITENRAKQGAAEQGVLFSFEVYFAANQNNFSADQYQVAFDKVIALAATYGGALMTIEGHSDPLQYLKDKKAGVQPLVLNQEKQAAKNLSFSRANAVKDSLIAYAASRHITLDPSQFGVVGLGVSQPNTPTCKLDLQGDIDLSCAPATEAQWNATRRVVFKIIQIEGEAVAFNPL